MTDAIAPGSDKILSAKPSLFGLRFHHFGLGVPAPEAAFRYLEALGYTPGNQVLDPLQRVNLAMRHHMVMPDVEVIWPGDGPSPLDRMLRKNGSMIYHICYEVIDPDAAVASMEGCGLDITQVSPPQPAKLFSGREVSFYSLADIGLIELLRA